VKLFQIEEPQGGPADAEAPGAAVGIDLSGSDAEVAFAVGGNAATLADRQGYEQRLPVPGLAAGAADWRELLDGVRLRAERALARPVTHAVVVLADADAAGPLRPAAREAGIELLRITMAGETPEGLDRVLGAAVLAEDLAPAPPIADFR
jgi:hypothetical protein